MDWPVAAVVISCIGGIVGLLARVLPSRRPSSVPSAGEGSAPPCRLHASLEARIAKLERRADVTDERHETITAAIDRVFAELKSLRDDVLKALHHP